ncbi:serine/arginine-rich SC35-like splicing factor SCL30A [Artemisia annua]|uniref:Serine/arginine-rich SC35-like splicing factor SCL30A n=1 Tax=Artemisia annua TaxID=35608 RepID=A0A2U1KDS2_ARTAN|nr:serine/arginine-rich SC35-like splicing factor SCL30A [Artemisia annua]
MTDTPGGHWATECPRPSFWQCSDDAKVRCCICGREHRAKDCSGVGCYKCSKVGHLGRDCGQVWSGSGGDGVCYYCGMRGYMAVCSLCGETGHLDVLQRDKSMGRRGYSPSPPRGGYERRRRSPTPPRSRYGGGGSRGRPVERDLPTSLLVRNLRLDCRPEDLRRPFGQFGPLKDIYLPRDYYSGEPRGFGFVQYVEPADAAEAKYQMDGQVLQGREMTVVFAEDNRKKPSDMKIRERRSGSRYNERSRRSPPRRYSPPPPRRPRQKYDDAYPMCPIFFVSQNASRRLSPRVGFGRLL